MGSDGRPKSLTRACLSCRAKKIRCDARHPRCSACTNQARECIYRAEPPRKRPTLAQIHNLQRDKDALEAFIVSLKQSSPEERATRLDDAVPEDRFIQLPSGAAPSTATEVNETRRASLGSLIESSDDELDITHFISVDDAGKPRSFGPSSALHIPTRGEITPLSQQVSSQSLNHENIRNSLIANAALQRQLEHGLSRLPDIDGTPTELGLHLLNLHWMRQHHSFLLTYRPTIMRDLQCNGPFASKFLLNAIFACSSKFSPCIEFRENPSDPATAGRNFFRRCDELLARDGLLIQPSLPTVVGLLLLGSTYVACGETSKGWLYTGYALRMVYDLGLHLDPKQTTNVAEDVEIRRRVFWGAFVCDKLQSLYLGRPVAINLRDSHVSREFLDLYEENEPFMPYSEIPTSPGISISRNITPMYSVSTFQQLCLLSKIMTTIINRFYVVGATFSNVQNSLQLVDNALQSWKQNLPPDLDFQPWVSAPTSSLNPPPNVMILHNIYHSLIILVHRPLISDGHLRTAASTPAHSWERCTTAARCITNISLEYKSAFSLSAAPYVLGYTIYVACTIHVRNAAAQRPHGREHLSLLSTSLQCLDDLCLPNPGVAKPASIIRKLIDANQLELTMNESPASVNSVPPFDLDAILNMFPSNAPLDDEMGCLDLPLDPLFGLMNEPTMMGPGILESESFS